MRSVLPAKGGMAAYAVLLMLLLGSCDRSATEGDASAKQSKGREFVPIRINCGGGKRTDRKTGIVWSSDKEYKRRGVKYKFKETPIRADVEGPAPKEVYQTARRQAVAFRFKKVPDGLYRVRLHFMDGKRHANRAMDFWLEGLRLVHNFNIAEAANGVSRATVMEVIVRVSDGNGMDIKGSRGRGDDVVISGIEILPAPPRSVESSVQEEHYSDAPAGFVADLKKFAEDDVKLVWTRTENEEDYYSKTDSSLLMSYDSKDGRERAILPRLGSYAMPMISPDGSQVVFTDNLEGKCFAVNFDGTNLRELAEGSASDVWIDPATNRTWVYLRTGWRDLNAPIVRVDLSNPSVKETVWNQSATGQEQALWFSLSTDGTVAADGFPWPSCGLANLQSGDIHFMGKGCWPGLAPNDSHSYFYFVGKHTEIEFFDRPDSPPRTIDLATVPNWQGRKLYHPRWSNNVRYITATAPQWMPETELYIGKFDAGFTKIEEWFRVTYNETSDFFGDAWFAGNAPKALLGQANTPAITPGTTAPAPVAVKPAVEISPLAEGLAFIWENERAKNAVIDAQGKIVKSWSLRYDGETRPNAWFGADVRNGGLVPPVDALPVVGSAIASPRGFSLTVDASPVDTARTGDIAFIGGKEEGAVLAIRQVGQEYVASLISADGGIKNVSLGQVIANKMTQLTTVYDGKRLTTFRDGVETAGEAVNLPVGPLPVNTMMYGRGPLGEQTWQGALRNIRLYQRALTAVDIKALHEVSRNDWSKFSPIPRVVVEAELIQGSQPSDPRTIAPYSRSLAENLYKVKRVISGEFKEETIIVLQWAILSSKILPSANREDGQTFQLTLEASGAHPELDGEHRSTDLFDATSPVFYDVGS